MSSGYRLDALAFAVVDPMDLDRIVGKARMCLR
jgi:hypothetical protein